MIYSVYRLAKRHHTEAFMSKLSTFFDMKIKNPDDMSIFSYFLYITQQTLIASCLASCALRRMPSWFVMLCDQSAGQ
jgi:hypothetical protein